VEIWQGGHNIGLFGIWKKSDRFGAYYEHDSKNKTFKTIDEVRKYALSVTNGDY
jgi:hypothetical protein